jgi:hypothetical protein
VEERLDHFCCLGGIEPGSVVAVPATQGGLDGASGKRFGATFGHHRIDTARDRIPYQLRQSPGQAERVEYQTWPIIARSDWETKKKIIDFG